MERENQRVVITKRMLKESMLRILKDKDLDSITVAELCRDAGINRATFYRHYEIPRDVLFEIQRDLYYELRQQIGIPLSIAEIHPVIEKLCYYMNAHLELLRILVRSNSDTDFTNFMKEICLELAKEFQHTEVMKKLSQEDIQLLTLYSTGGSYFILRGWIMGTIKKTSKEMADYVTNLINKTAPLLINNLAERSKA